MTVAEPSASPLLSASDAAAETGAMPPAIRRFDGTAAAVNWRGAWTLYLKEVRRFLNVYTQTVAAPVVTTLLFLAVFALALGRAGAMVQGVPYAEFLAPGLIMMAMTQNAFANTSSSITIAKVQGNIVDILMPPLSAIELTVAYALAGVTRGLFVGLVVGLAMWSFVPLHLAHPGFVLFHGFAGSLMLALLGVIGGIWSEKFDHIAAVTNFVVTPAAFLSGTFYSVTRLPEPWASVAHANPFFYMIDGFRYGFIGAADATPLVGLAVLAATNLALGTLAWRMFATGYRLKA
jgi:ABC-2 type transport system permease protein